MNRKVAPGVAFLLCSAFVLHSHFSMASKSATADGNIPDSAVYCLNGTATYGDSFFAEKRAADGSIVFSMHTATSDNDSFYWAFGTAKKVAANHWRWVDSHPDNSCAMDIKFDNNSWSVAADKSTPCTYNMGARGPDVVPLFPASSYRGPVGKKFDTPEKMSDASICAPYPKPTAPVPTAKP